MVKLYLHSPMCLHGMVLNKINTETTSSFTVLLVILSSHLPLGLPSVSFLQVYRQKLCMHFSDLLCTPVTFFLKITVL
jgi:hypothetical protein